MSASPLEVVLSRVTGARQQGRDYVARCPAHDDHRPSLHVKESVEGKVLLWCAVGCPRENVVAALGLSWVDLFPRGSRERQRPRVWKGIVPIAPHGRPALECMGDDAAASMLGELARLAHVRGRLDDRAVRCINYIAGATGSTRADVQTAIQAALEVEDATPAEVERATWWRTDAERQARRDASADQMDEHARYAAEALAELENGDGPAA